MRKYRVLLHRTQALTGVLVLEDGVTPESLTGRELEVFARGAIRAGDEHTVVVGPWSLLSAEADQ